MSYTILGTCSLCGGRVTVPEVWFGTYPPTPSCERCHATARSHGPVIDMEPPRVARDVFITTDGVVFPINTKGR